MPCGRDRTHGQRRSDRHPGQDRRQRLGEQQSASAPSSAAPQPGDCRLAAALVGCRHEDEPQHRREQQPELRHEQGPRVHPHGRRDVTAGIFDAHRELRESGHRRAHPLDVIDAHPVGREREIDGIPRLEP